MQHNYKDMKFKYLIELNRITMSKNELRCLKSINNMVMPINSS